VNATQGHTPACKIAVSRRVRWVGHVAHVEETRGMWKILVGNPERKGPLWRVRRSKNDNIKIDRKGIECEDLNWIHLAQYRVQWWTVDL